MQTDFNENVHIHVGSVKFYLLFENLPKFQNLTIRGSGRR